MHVKIGDFGISAFWDDEKVIGHVDYCAPEVSGENGIAKQRARFEMDIYALGKTLDRFAAEGPIQLSDMAALAKEMTHVVPSERTPIAEVVKHPALAGKDADARKVLDKVKKSAPPPPPAPAQDHTVASPAPGMVAPAQDHTLAPPAPGAVAPAQASAYVDDGPKRPAPYVNVRSKYHGETA
jgi:serine/threonine protein kinase